MRGRPCQQDCNCGRHKRERVANPGYKTVHSRVTAQLGKASEQDCVDCGEQAQDWSKAHDRDGLSVYDYDARCKKCHCLYDGYGGGPNSKAAGHKKKEVR